MFGKGAFTLIEILVTVAVVAVLALIVWSASWKVYEASSLAVSANNLRQLAAGASGYLADHRQTFWRYRENVPGGGGVRWWFGLEPVSSLRAGEGSRSFDATQGPLGGYVPAATRPDPSFQITGHAFKPKYRSGYIGVGYNVLLAESTANRLKAWNGAGQPARVQDLSDPAQVVVFATSAQINTFQSPASSTNPMVEEFYGIDDVEKTVHFRHGKTAMVVFANGSVGFLPCDESTLDKRLPRVQIGRFAPSGSKKYLR
jgi:prepilin-type N-terminal cleavage/methylation domain-containing protein